MFRVCRASGGVEGSNVDHVKRRKHVGKELRALM